MYLAPRLKALLLFGVLTKHPVPQSTHLLKPPPPPKAAWGNPTSLLPLPLQSQLTSEPHSFPVKSPRTLLPGSHDLVEKIQNLLITTTCSWQYLGFSIPPSSFPSINLSSLKSQPFDSWSILCHHWLHDFWTFFFCFVLVGKEMKLRMLFWPAFKTLLKHGRGDVNRKISNA